MSTVTVGNVSEYTTLFHEVDTGRHLYHLGVIKLGQEESRHRVFLVYRAGGTEPVKITRISASTETVESLDVLHSRQWVKDSPSLRMGLAYIKREHPENGVPLGLTLFAHVDPRAYAKYLEDTE